MAVMTEPTTRTDLFRQVSAWVPGESPKPITLAEAYDADRVRWFDIGRDTDAAEVVATIGPVCEGLTMAMVEDLLTPDDEPEGQRYGDGRIRLASTFDAEARRYGDEAQRG